MSILDFLMDCSVRNQEDYGTLCCELKFNNVNLYLFSVFKESGG